jgi:predicted alpha-1,2-mannosidase
LAFLLLGCAACGSGDSSSGEDAAPPGNDGAVDATGMPEASTDSGPVDAGHMPDATTPDSGAPETGTTTEAGSEAGTPDGGSPEAGGGVEGGIDGGPWLTDPASYVDTRIGTTGGGNTFPGPDVPFGMVQWSPDTSPNRNDGSGYDNGDTQLLGFSLTHISGPGCGAFGDIPILPLTGGLPAGDPGSHLEPLTHTGEVTNAGYYSVQSGSPAIKTELTATLRSGMGRFTFPATTNANLLIKLLASQNGSVGSSATVVGTNEIQGSTTSGFFCGAGDKYTVYFDLVFDTPFTASQVINNTAGTMKSVVFLTFDTTKTQTIQAKVGISWVSAQNAQANWTADNPAWNFDAVKQSAHDAWNVPLNKIQIAGAGPSDAQLFYTALYHSLIHPNVFSDSNGQYMGFDNVMHTVSGTQKAQYANYSGWDIYHSQVQLSALLEPDMMSDSAQSMVNDAAQNNGMLPKWALANGESYVMVGDPSDGIIAGYYAFGAKNFDTATALQTMLKEANTPNNIRPGLSYYETLGYLPDDGAYTCCNFYGSVATTLEYAEADFALSQFASALGDTTNATALLKRSQNWQNVYDPASTFFNPRLANGTFVSGIGLTSGQGMVEGSASQYRWIISYNHAAQLAAMGGPSVVNPLLQSFFSNLDDQTGQYAFFANEFQLGAQYWNDFTGQPYAAQNVVNRLRTQVFSDAPAFFNNNDDLGAESSLLAWSMLGLYPEYPGSAIMTLNAPQFPQALIHLPSGATLALNAAGVSSSAPYVQSLQVNGQASTKPWIDAPFMTSGGTLDFTMGSSPNTSWGSAAADAPPSFGTGSTAAIGFVQPAALVLAPGGQGTATIGAQSARSDVTQDVTWSTSGNADAGANTVGVSQSNGTLSLTAGGQSTQALTITAPLTQGQYVVSFPMTSSLGVPAPSPAISVIVASPGSIWPYFNNAGTSDDTTGTADFDGVGYSYSKQGLAAANVTPGSTVTVGSIAYSWPNVAIGQYDNIITGGQTITFNETAAKTTIGMLGSATNAGAGGASGTMTITYMDNSTQSVNLVFTDWTKQGGGGALAANNTIAITTTYRDYGTQKDGTAAYVFAFTALLSNGSSPVKSITLPSQTTGGVIHVFDIQLH